MAEINYFYIDKQGNQQGPRSIEQLKNAHVIFPDTMMWSQGMTDWCRASSIAELSDIFTQMPPIAPIEVSQTTYIDAPVPIGERPHTWLIESIIATFFCCFAFGITGIIFASKVNNLWNDGKYEQARSAASTAGLMIILSIISVILMIIIYFMFLSAII